MNEKELFESDLYAFALKYSLTRVKMESYNFIRDYQLGQDGKFTLVSEKAIIRALGKVSKVPIGENEQYKNLEEAEIGVRKHWSDYFKKRRESRSETDKRAEAIRQKRYREKRKSERIKVERAQ